VRLWRAGHAEEAIRELQAARSEGRLQWQAMYYLGHCFKSRQNWPLARRNFEESLKLLPESEVAHKKELLFELASGHAEVREFERAVELALDLADLDYAYRGIGRLLEEWQEQGKKNGTPTKRL
jgi:tetratricopeptide (TPR) repeat protein